MISKLLVASIAIYLITAVSDWPRLFLHPGCFCLAYNVTGQPPIKKTSLNNTVTTLISYSYDVITIGDQTLVDTSLQDASEVFKAGGGKSVLIGSSGDDNTNSFLLIPHSREGMEIFFDSNKRYSVMVILQSKN